MDVSGETADLVVREAVQVSEEVIKFLGAGAKNLTAFLAAMYSQNNKVVGKTTAKRLARDPAPAEIVQLKKEDIPKFQKLAKQYGVLYFLSIRMIPSCHLRMSYPTPIMPFSLMPSCRSLAIPSPKRPERNHPQKKSPPALNPNDPHQSERMARKRGRGLRHLRSHLSGADWLRCRKHLKVWNGPRFLSRTKHDKEETVSLIFLNSLPKRGKVMNNGEPNGRQSVTTSLPCRMLV